MILYLFHARDDVRELLIHEHDSIAVPISLHHPMSELQDFLSVDHGAVSISIAQ